MPVNYLRLSQYVAICALLTSCKEPGTFTINFVWPEGVKPSPTLTLYANAFLSWGEGGSEPSTSGEASIGGGKPGFTFSGLNYDKEYILTVEIYEKTEKKNQVVYFGKSKAFTIEAGKDTAVAVDVPLKPTPGHRNDGIDAPMNIQIVGWVEYQGEYYVTKEPVTISVHVENADKIWVSNISGTAGFEEPKQTEPGMTPGEIIINNWPLGIGDGGTKSVWVKLSNNENYETDAEMVSVTLDKTDPAMKLFSVELTPHPGSKLVQVGKITFDTTVVVKFTASELLKDVELITNGDWSVDKDKADFPGKDFEYHLTLARGTPVQGVQELVVSLVDRAGRRSEPKRVDLLVDTLPPAPITAEQNDIVFCTRIPWGNDISKGMATFTVSGGAGAVEPDSTVIAFDGPDTATATEIGRNRANADGAFGGDIGSGNELFLTSSDLARVYIAQVDDAGNLDSPTATLVRNTEWVATMGSKVIGSTNENPHIMTERVWFEPSLIQDGAIEVSGSQTIRNDNDLLTTPGGGKWRKPALEQPSPPDGRNGHAMAYDIARGRTVMFGGMRDSVTDETWEWDGDVWTTVCGGNTQCHGPIGRYQHAMAYDSARGYMVLFGGSDGTNSLDDTWEWDGTTWTEVSVEGSQPSKRSGHVMTYDRVRHRIVLFGGITDTSISDETWEWDGKKWQPLCGTGTQCTGPWPSGRKQAAATYDETTQTITLFGGMTQDGKASDELWVWDGISWVQRCGVSTACSGPEGRYGHILTWMSIGTVLYGGALSDGVSFGDMWKWQNGLWTQVCGVGATPCTDPSNRTNASAVFDAGRERLVHFGGWTGLANDDGTWEWAGSAWYNVSGSGKKIEIPAPRRNHSAVFDETQSAILVFGGSGEDFIQTDQLWKWDGKEWRLQCGSGTQCTGPSGRDGSALVFDILRDRTVLFGGTSHGSETWEYDGSTWAKVCQSDTSCPGPTWRWGNAMAFDRHDEKDGRTVLFGGIFVDLNQNATRYDETWKWDGSVWEKACGTGTLCLGPSARDGTAMAYDETRNVTVLFGGCTSGVYSCDSFSDETWEWDGTSWLRRCDGTPSGGVCSSPVPAGRTGHSLVYDRSRKKVVLFGGSTLDKDGNTVLFDDVWEWDGARWHLANGGAKGSIWPAKREKHAAAFFPGTGEMLVFGGMLEGEIGNKTYLWNGGADHEVGQVMLVDFSRSGDIGHDVQNISITARAGGIGFPGGTPQPGAKLLYWTPFGWERCSENTAPLDAPDSVSCDITDQIIMSGLLNFWPRKYFGVALTPVAPNGPANAQIPYGGLATDSLGVKVRYLITEP
jgi:hypothetical protein